MDNFTGLQSARILAGRNVPVIGVANDPRHPCSKTRVCRRIYYADARSLAFIDLLLDLGTRLEQKAVLFPCTDFTVLNVSRHRKDLAPYYHTALPDEDTVELLMDKFRFYTFAQREGLPIPGTFFLKNRQDAERAAEALSYPCILKPPVKTPQWEQHTKAKVYKIISAGELLSTYDRTRKWAPLLMVQEWIVGKDENLFSCNCYYDDASNPLVTFVAKKLRQWPPETGTSSLGVECRNDVVLQETLRLFRTMRFRGLGYLEMKRDERDGRHFIIEPNIGRPTGRSAICEAGGVDLLYTMYCDSVGLPLPPNRTQEYAGVKWIYLRRDLQSALAYWRRGQLTFEEWRRSMRGPKAYALFSWKDPVPFIEDIRVKLRDQMLPSFKATFSRSKSAGEGEKFQGSRFMADKLRG